MKVWIDPGHGGADSGTTGCNRRECDDTLTYALELDRQFKAQGFDTLMTRTTDKTVKTDDRTKMERLAKCDLAISCHRNGFNKDATGFEIWIHSAAQANIVAWAQEICDGVSELGINMHGDVGVKKGFTGKPNANYYANSGTNSPSMLIEFCYVQNPSDNALFDKHYKAACTIIVKASCRFLEVEYRDLATPEEPTVPEDAENSDLLDRIADLERQLHGEHTARELSDQRIQNAVDILTAK